MRSRRTVGQKRSTGSLLFGWILVAIATFETRRVFDTQFSPVAMIIATAALAAVAIIVWSLVWPLRLLFLTLATTVAAFAVTLVDGRPRGFDLAEAIVDAPLHGFGQVAAAVWPSPSLPAGIAAFAMLTSASSGIVADLALRRRVGASLFPPTLVLGVVALLSADGGPPSSWTIMAFVLAVVGLLRSAQPRSHSNVSRALTAVMVVFIAAAPIAGAELAAKDRYNPRSASSGREPADTGINPFGRVPQWRALADDPEMFRSDSAQPGRWRLVALPRFDGRDWLPADNYRVAGSLLRAADPDQPSTIVGVTLAGLDAPWLPTPGDTVEVSRSVEVDSDLSSLLIERTDPVTVLPGRASTEMSGETYQITVQPLPEAADVATSGVAGDAEQMFVDDFTPPQDIVQIALDVTTNATTDAERAEQLAKFLRENFVLDPDLPPGHSMAMLDAFLLSTKRGTDEQFVGAYAVLAASLGLPTRISVGFETRSDVGGSESGTVANSSDAVAWPEVLFEDLGWVSFDPVPAEENKDIAGTGIGPTGPSVVLDSPAPPVSLPAQTQEAEIDTAPIAPSARPTPETIESRISVIVAAASVVGALVAIAIVYVAVVLGLKRRRLRRRQRIEDPRTRILGALRSGVDVLVDLGAKVSPAQTDREAITVRDPALRQVSHLLKPVARSATAAVYSSELVFDDGHADDAWSDVQDFAREAGRNVGRRRSLRARLSTRSLRRGLPDS